MNEVVRGRIAERAATHSGLALLLLFGSRARGDAHPRSDWDFGYLVSGSFDPDALLAELALLTEADRIDLVNLDRASGLLRYRAAAEGVVVWPVRSYAVLAVLAGGRFVLVRRPPMRPTR